MAYRKKEIKHQTPAPHITPPKIKQFNRIEPYWPLTLHENTEPSAVTLYTEQEIDHKELEKTLRKHVKCDVHLLYWLDRKYVIVLLENIRMKKLSKLVFKAVKRLEL